MSEHLEIAKGNKADKYSLLLRQIEALADGENDMIALMANISSMIHFTFDYLWTGFYRVSGPALILGPFQGPLACTRIPFGKGVCGTAWKDKQTLVVAEVNEFPGHIACSSESKSEIVVPIKANGNVIGVLDIDSDQPGTFDQTDALWLERIAQVIENRAESGELSI